jgi:hypothetical protein
MTTRPSCAAGQWCGNEWVRKIGLMSALWLMEVPHFRALSPERVKRFLGQGVDGNFAEELDGALSVHAFVGLTPDVSSQSWSLRRRFSKHDEVLASL